MDLATAQARLERYLAWDQDPALTSGEVQDLLNIAKLPDANGADPRAVTTTAAWASGTAYGVNTVVRQSASANRWWICTVTGVSSTTVIPPYWPDLSRFPRTQVTVIDGTVIWADAGAQWSPQWNLYTAAAEGWRWKAAKAAPRFNFSTDNQKFDRSDVIAHCLSMAALYSKYSTGSARVGS